MGGHWLEKRLLTVHHLLVWFIWPMQTVWFTSGEERVEDDLGPVEEVSELGLPDGQQARLGDAHTVLEAQHRLLRQGAVTHLHTHRQGAVTHLHTYTT